MKKTTTDMTFDRLASLLALGMEAAEDADAQDALGLNRELLEAFLARKLSLEETGDAPGRVLKRPCEELREHVDRSIGEVLTGPGTGLDALRTLKDYGKALVGAARSQAEKAAATALYYAAIAAALAFHNERVTRLDEARLISGLEALKTKPWVTGELKDVYLKALARCRDSGAK